MEYNIVYYKSIKAVDDNKTMYDMVVPLLLAPFLNALHKSLGATDPQAGTHIPP